ncbi:MAG: hypothetical protein ACYCX4_17645 [Bacillota bacterium]
MKITQIGSNKIDRLNSLRDRQLEKWFKAKGARKTQLLVRIIKIDNALEQATITTPQAGICIPPARSMGVRTFG